MRLTEKRFPFTICAGTAYAYDKKKSPTSFIPFEFTPLYVGVPMNPKKISHDFTVEGGFTQSLLMNSEVTDKATPKVEATKGSYIANLPLPKKVVKVAEICGISSAAVAFTRNIGESSSAAMTNLLGGLGDASLYNFWSPTSGGASQQFGFVDGALYDNSGVVALLRRGCKTVICCVAVDSDVTTDIKKTWYDFANLFGVAKQSNVGEKAFETYNSRNQVFESKEWDVLTKVFEKKVSV